MAIRPFVDRSMTRRPLSVEGELRGHAIGVPAVLAAESRLLGQLRVAIAIARDAEACIHVIDPRGEHSARRIPGDADGDTIDAALGEWALDRDRTPVSSRQAARETQEYVSAEALDTVVVPAGEDGSHSGMAARLDCDVLTIKGEEEFRDFASMLVPVAGGPHAGGTIDAAARLASRCDAWIDLLHVVPADVDEDEIERTEARLAEIADDVAVTESVTPWVLSADDPTATILEQCRYYGLTVIGAPTSGRLKRFLYGSTSRTIRERAESAVMAVRTIDRDA